METFGQLLATKQYYVAAWRVITSQEDGPDPDQESIGDVSSILVMAIEDQCFDDVRRIANAFGRWVDAETRERVSILLSATAPARAEIEYPEENSDNTFGDAGY